ncbi:iron-containing alcohol dehydrogenase [Tomitella fengzijianii]|nr:iron-containing alcohol dehydrogenase [Tomitella fengzijianii]
MISARVFKFHAPEIVFGDGAMPEASFAALRFGGARPLVVTDAGVLAAGWPQMLLDGLRTQGMEPELWSGLTPNPKDHEIADGHRAYAGHGCDVIIALGGGSVIDAAKGIAILAANGGRILDYVGIDRAQSPIPPLVVVPTTSGSGADVSQFCVVTDTDRRAKVTIIGRALVPNVTVVDPRLLPTMPERVAATTGLDALTHGIEAYVSVARTPLTDRHALQAVGLVFDHLTATLERPDVMADRRAMALASLEAGMAFSNAILGAAHAVSHQVGGMLDATHGEINGIVLPHVIRFNAETDPQPYEDVARHLGLTVRGNAPQAAAWAVAEHVEALVANVGMPAGLAQLGVRDEDLPRLARGALQDACMTTNPRAADEAAMVRLLRDSL